MKDLNFTPVSVHDTDAQALGEAFSAEPDPSPHRQAGRRTGNRTLGADQHQNARGNTTCRETARLETRYAHAGGYRHRPAQLPEQ